MSEKSEYFMSINPNIYRGASWAETLEPEIGSTAINKIVTIEEEKIPYAGSPSHSVVVTRPRVSLYWESMLP